jgi:arabinofuranosyltransferase
VRVARSDDLLAIAATTVPLALFLLRERLIAGAAGFPLDDSWIHLHFARNLAAGAGFSYNPGVPVAGSTAPLWTLLLGAGALVAGPTLVMAKAIGIATMLGAALLVRRAALAWGATRDAAIVAAVALVWSGPVAWGALSGMEVPLALALVSGALLAHARGCVVVTAALAALAALARPEAILLIPLLALAGARLSVARAAVFATAAIVVLAPSVAFSLATVGAPVPATAAAKVEGGLLGWLGGVHEPLSRTFLLRPREFFGGWVRWLWSTHWLLPVTILPALALAWRRAGRLLGIPALVLVVQPLAMALLAPYREPGFQEGRYSTHLLPVALVVLAVSAPRDGWRLRRGILAGWLVLALLALPAAADRYAWGVQNINAMQVHLGRWVDGHLPREARIAVNDIGAIAFFSRRHVIDLMGLVTPDIIPYRREGERGVIRYVTERCPDYAIVFPTWFPELVGRRDLLAPVYSVRLAHNLVSGGPEMVVYRVAHCAL